MYINITQYGKYIMKLLSWPFDKLILATMYTCINKNYLILEGKAEGLHTVQYGN